MALPFATLALALFFTWREMRGAALAGWGVSLLLLLALFRWHATAPLNLSW